MKIEYKTMYKMIIALLSAAGALILVLYLIFRPDFSTNQKEGAHLIGASYMTMNNEFYEILNEQISHRVEAEGDRLILRDPALSVSRQVDCTIVSDNYKAGCKLGECLLQNRENSDIVIMTHDTAVSGQERVQGFLDTIEGHEGIRVVEKVPCEGQLEIAMPAMEELIEKGVIFDSVFCLNDPSSLGAAAALESKDLLDKVDIYGIDASPDAKQLIYEGKMVASVAQFPSRIGEEAANAIYDLLEGREVKSYISVPVELVTRENVEQYNVDRWQ